MMKEAEDLGLGEAGSRIGRALVTDRARSTLSCYRAELRKFEDFRRNVKVPNLPIPQMRNYYVAQCAVDGRQKALPLIVAAMNYFLGPLPEAERSIEGSIVEAEKRASPPVKHHAKVDPAAMRKIVLEGTRSSDPKTTQAAVVALLQFKALLRISEAMSILVKDLTCKQHGLWTLLIRRSKTDQFGEGTCIPIKLDKLEHNLLRTYVDSAANQLFLFQSATSGLPLTYSALRDRLRALLTATQLDHLNLTSHSFRGGAASHALDMGYDQTRVMQAGRWRSVTAFKCYVSPKPLDLPTAPSNSTL